MHLRATLSSRSGGQLSVAEQYSVAESGGTRVEAHSGVLSIGCTSGTLWFVRPSLSVLGTNIMPECRIARMGLETSSSTEMLLAPGAGTR